MKIYVNDKKLDFRIEEEKNLFDIIDAIKTWGENDNLYIKEIIFHDRTFYANNEDFKKIGLDEVDEISFYLISPQELALSSLSDCLAFFDNLSRNEEQYKNPAGLLDFLQWIYNIITKSKVILGLDFNQNLGSTSVNKELIKLNNIITQYSDFLTTQPSAEETKNFLQTNINFEAWSRLISGIILQAQDKMKQTNTPVSKEELMQRIKAGQNKIPEMIKDIETITEYLHSGNDAEGMMLLENIGNNLTTIIQDLQLIEQILSFKYSDIKIGDTPVSDELIGLTDILSQIVDSFKNNDIVLLCDLLEYELSPKLETLSEIIDILLKEMEGNYN